MNDCPNAVAPLRVQLISKQVPATTGLGRYATEVANGLQAAGVECRSAAIRTPVTRYLVQAGHRLGYDLEAFLGSYPLRADVGRSDVTHLTSQTLATLLFTQRLPRPVVVTVHDLFPYLFRGDPVLRVYGSRFEQLVDRLAMRALRRADRLVAISDFTKRTLVDALAIPPDRISVIHNGVDTARFRPLPVPASFRQRYGIPEDAVSVLYVGSEDPRKNVSLLLRAFSLVRQTNPRRKALLLKIGSPAFPEERARHEQLCSELGIAGAVRWLDAVPEADLPLFYNLADAFAFPSRYEGFGLPVLEALACGTPVVALRAGSIPELVSNLAILVDADDPAWFAVAIGEAIKRRQEAVDDRVEHAGRFTWQRTVQGLLEVYEHVRSDRSSARKLTPGGTGSTEGTSRVRTFEPGLPERCGSCPDR